MPLRHAPIRFPPRFPLVPASFGRFHIMLPRPAFRRGSVLTIAIIVSFVLTGLVMTLAWMAGEQTQRTASLKQMDQAFFAAEAGAQRVEWYCKHRQLGSVTSPITGSVGNYTYSASWTPLSGSTIRITSVGSRNAVSYNLTQDVTPPSSPLATIASVGDFDNKNLNITGNVSTGGNYSNSNGGALNGHLIYAGTAPGTANVTGAIIQSSFSPIDFNALDTSLRSNATTLGTNATYDFTLLTGNNKVIYVNGNVVNPKIIGAGTLYVNGTISITSNLTIGSALAPVYLVATGNVTFNKNTTLNGGLYTPATWTRAQIAGTAVIYIGQQIDKSNSGTSSMTMGAAPWFEPRGSGITTTGVTNFAGPQP
jgi:Tfp pilus assembly protein PilX